MNNKNKTEDKLIESLIDSLIIENKRASKSEKTNKAHSLSINKIIEDHLEELEIEQMSIERIEIQNFRGFYGDHEIDLSVDDKKSVTLIIAENGVGKSTILNSIFWCLSCSSSKTHSVQSKVSKIF